MRRGLLLLIFSLILMVSCGDSKIEVQSTLLVVDTYPSNGAEVDPYISDIFVFFSSKIDSESLSNDSFLLELVGEVSTTAEGSKVKTDIVEISEDKTSVHITILDKPLVGGSIYRLTINNVKSASGNMLQNKYYKFFSVKRK